MLIETEHSFKISALVLELNKKKKAIKSTSIFVNIFLTFQ